jgi:O-antigen ligase
MMRWDRLAGIALILALAGLALMPIMMERLSHDYGAGNAQKAAWEERWGLMRIAFNMIAHHPLTGVGPGAYMYTYKEYIPPGLHQWVFAVHNEFLLRAAETGIAGAIAFFALIVAGFRSGIRLIRSQRIEFITVGAGWIAALASLVWQMSWVPWTGFTYNAMLWFMLGLTDAVCRFDDTNNVKAEPVRTYLKRAPGSPTNAEMKA